jgi:hypothetical protein
MDNMIKNTGFAALADILVGQSQPCCSYHQPYSQPHSS